MTRLQFYRTGGEYIGPAHSKKQAMMSIKKLAEQAKPGEPYATLYKTNKLGVHVLEKTFYKEYQDYASYEEILDITWKES